MALHFSHFIPTALIVNESDYGMKHSLRMCAEFAPFFFVPIAASSTVQKPDAVCF